MVALREDNIDKYYQYCTNLLRMFFAAGVVLAIAVNIFALTMMTPLLGQEYADSIVPLMILAWSYVATFAGSVRAQIFFIDNINIYHVYNALVGIAFLIPLNLFLIPRFGATGAAIATLIGYFVSGLGTSYIFPKLRYIGKMQIRAIFPGYDNHESV